MTVEEARAALLAGERIKMVVGEAPDDPTLILHHDDGMVISTSVAGWSAGVVEPVCSIKSDFLVEYLLGRHSVEIVQTSALGEEKR